MEKNRQLLIILIMISHHDKVFFFLPVCHARAAEGGIDATWWTQVPRERSPHPRNWAALHREMSYSRSSSVTTRRSCRWWCFQTEWCYHLGWIAHRSDVWRWPGLGAQSAWPGLWHSRRSAFLSGLGLEHFSWLREKEDKVTWWWWFFYLHIPK